MKDFVPFNIAKKLEEKGFKEECLFHYEKTGGIFSIWIDTYDRPNQELDYSDFLKCYNDGNSFGLIDAPTISQVIEWLRREKNIYISIFIDDDSDCPVTYEIYKGTECMRTHHGEYFELKDWNKCELRAIEYVLDNLI